MGHSTDDDPLTLAIAPPPNETPEEKEARLKAEAEARSVSEKIDEQLKAERAALKKKKPVKVLLLGQSESGKSTTLKNFQLTYSPKSWAEERESWRIVIQLNITRNVNMILDLLSEEMSNPSILLQGSVDSDESDDDSPLPGSPSNAPLRFTDKHALLKLRLGPLRGVQRDLEQIIGTSSNEEVFFALPGDPQALSPPASKSRPKEAFIRANHTWKLNNKSQQAAVKHFKENKVHEATEIIAGCADDMRAIWDDATVQQMLRKRRIRMEAMSGFFLNDAERIAMRNYQPSDDDIVRARLRTLGVQEYPIKFETGPATGSDWILYDVGGSRTQRAAWFPYFDDCDAIIFLAPISCFDERLAEDRKVNRLEDSYMLWRLVCSSKLLAKTQIILFLNKCDLLDQKLKSGIFVKDHVRSYGDRSNDAVTASKYFSSHFKEIMRRHSPESRTFRVHMTSVIDTTATAATLGVVEEGILQGHLRSVDLI
ncbi:uncharacterized protein FIBRA_06271 [Fibroporia radiculosa]|uniref:G-alpha-domain-containing protein n=1 Tax=Fibroporia radiculosa TaxID=599839 RepID=J4IB63_9APHY|nr:uncharacterized protein FIBRA_06271 [Fibroporia radiculosa]CCM04111.1 predicted protein [Fibroporia radiculosa]